MSAADEAYDRLHGVDGHTQAGEGQDQTSLAQADVDALRELLDLMENFPDNDQRARYLLTCNWMRAMTAHVAEFQWNALEMARKADIAERRAEEAEFHVEQLRDARDLAERRVEAVEALIEKGQLDEIEERWVRASDLRAALAEGAQ
jgi:hypothetical protein